VTVSNCAISDDAWLQAALPVRWGGLGIRSFSSLASSAFLASSTAARALATSLLPRDGARPLLQLQSLAEADWLGKGGTTIPDYPSSISQRAWDDPICCAQFEHLLGRASEGSRARLLACRSASSGYWLSALPSANLGLRLGDAETRISVGLRLGASIVMEHNCICGARVDPDGLHGLSCRRSAGRHSRHAAINTIVALALGKADIPARLELPQTSQTPASIFTDQVSIRH